MVDNSAGFRKAIARQYDLLFDDLSVDGRAQIQNGRETVWKESRAMQSQHCAFSCALDYAEHQMKQVQELASDPAQGHERAADMFAECQRSMNDVLTYMDQSGESLRRLRDASAALLDVFNTLLPEFALGERFKREVNRDNQQQTESNSANAARDT